MLYNECEARCHSEFDKESVSMGLAKALKDHDGDAGVMQVSRFDLQDTKHPPRIDRVGPHYAQSAQPQGPETANQIVA